MDTLIIGCGVSGLSCGIRLLEAGYTARIWARDLPPNTTSNVAAAIWYPYKAYPEDLVDGWGSTTYAELVRLAEVDGTGVIMRAGSELFREPVGDPWWRAAAPDFRHATADELPHGFAAGYIFSAPVIEMPIYLGYLVERFLRLGGQIEQRTLSTIDQALAVAELVINCAGLGARELVGDHTLVPIRGQVVRVAQAGVERFILDDYGPDGVTYIIPRSRDCILGGTAQDGDENLVADQAIAEAILKRCIALEPRLATAEILEHKVGLRPGRPLIRLEAEQTPMGKRIIHNYGHGGAGVTLSWGCAEQVVQLAGA